jgi:uncharacterized protein YndB with AHSA1/START domain
MDQATILHHTFVIDRRYAHPPEKVFSGFADPKKKRRWMGGDEDGWTIERFDMNFEVGGQESWRFRYQGGPLMGNEVRYLDIVPGRRIVIAYTMDTEGKRFSSSQQTIELLPDAGGTRLILTEQIAFLDGSDARAARRAGQGAWPCSLTPPWRHRPPPTASSARSATRRGAPCSNASAKARPRPSSCRRCWASRSPP